MILLQMFMIVCLLDKGKALAPVSRAENEIEGPYNVMVMEGEEAILSCQVSTPFKFCNFISPADVTYSLGPGFQDGRISFAQTDDPTKVCGIKVGKATEEDNGEWWCKVIVGVGGNVREVMGRANITVIKPPWGIQMEAGESEGANREVTCKAVGGRPAPTFTWERNGVLIQDLGAVEEWIYVSPNGTTVVEQTLSYKVGPKDEGDRMECIVNHPGYIKEGLQKDEVNRKHIIVDAKFVGDGKNEEEVLGEDHHQDAIKNDTEIKTIDGESNEIRESFDVPENLPEAEDNNATSANSTSNNSSLPPSASTPQPIFTPSSKSSTASIPSSGPQTNPKPDDVMEPSTQTSSDASTVTIEPDVTDIPDTSPPLPTPDANDAPDDSEGHVVVAVILVIIIMVIIFMTAVARSKGMLCFKEGYNDEVFTQEKKSLRFNSLEKGDYRETGETDIDEDESKKSTLQLQPNKHLFGSPTRV